MTGNIRDVAIANLDHTRNSNRNLLEKALQMRCEGYLAQAKTALLTRTIFEVNRGKREISSINRSLRAEKEIIEQQKQELEEVNRLLEESNADLEAYAYTISHDLKNPIHATLGLCGLLQSESAGLGEQQKHFIELIESSIGSMAGQIDGLLQLSYSSGGTLRHEEVNLSRLATEVIDELRVADPQRVVEVIIQPGLACAGDVHLLKSLLQNILSNAWKYTRNNPEARIIFSQHSTKSGKSVYRIEDNGVGFNMEKASRLFQPFQRQHKKEEFEGTGIGLATVKRIILRHHGQVWAESTPGKGTSLYFSLPRVVEKR